MGKQLRLVKSRNALPGRYKFTQGDGNMQGKWLNMRHGWRMSRFR